MKKINRCITLLVSLLLILSVTVTACSSKENTVDSKISETKTEDRLAADGGKREAAATSAPISGETEKPASAIDGASVVEGASDDFTTEHKSSLSEETSGTDCIPAEPLPGGDVEIITQPIPQAGLLTAGEWSDNKNPAFLKNLLANGQDMNYKSFFTAWNLTPFTCITTNITLFSGEVVEGAFVVLEDASGNPLWSGVTDNTGVVYMYYNLTTIQDVPSAIIVNCAGNETRYDLTEEDIINGTVNISVDTVPNPVQKLDLMFVVDTTGSMGDEIEYLQEELKDVINRVKEDNSNIPTRLSVNFYKDVEDDYVVRSYDFSENIDEQLTFLAAERASGGGDYEEAVEQALSDAINNHSWDEDSTKLIFLVLDAPAHNTDAIKLELAETLKLAAAKGIRIIPVASSGVDKDTEFMLRTFAMVTGGTYTFLTNDSGIGGDHIEPTIGEYTVEALNDLLVRVISSYLK